MAEAIITSDVGGFWIREIGIIDSDGDLFAVGKYPATYKPLNDEGSIKELGVRMILAVANAGDVIVTYNNGIMDGAANTNLDNLTFAGQKLFNDKADKSELPFKADLESPEFTGQPTAPTPDAESNDVRIATTAFVRAAIAALIDSSPEAMDTLNELATSLGDDPNFATTITNALAEKLPLIGGAMTGGITAFDELPTTVFKVRNTKAQTEDPGVDSPLGNGKILLIYDE